MRSARTPRSDRYDLAQTAFCMQLCFSTACPQSSRLVVANVVPRTSVFRSPQRRYTNRRRQKYGPVKKPHPFRDKGCRQQHLTHKYVWSATSFARTQIHAVTHFGRHLENSVKSHSIKYICGCMPVSEKWLCNCGAVRNIAQRIY